MYSISEILKNLDLTQVLLWGIGGIGSLWLVWYRKSLSQWRKFWREVTQGLKAIPEMKADVARIKYFVSPNGGGSLSDAVQRTEDAMRQLIESVELVVQTMWAENDSDDENGRFHADSDGENTYVNQIYARWLAVGKAELLGWNFLNFVHPDDVQRVRDTWAICRAEHRQYRAQYRMVSAAGDVVTVTVIATPIPEGPPAKRWIGVIRKVGVRRAADSV